MEVYRDSINAKSDIRLNGVNIMEIAYDQGERYDTIKVTSYIPTIECVGSEVFMQTEDKSYVMDNRGDYIKFLSLDSDMKITHDSGYPFARVSDYLVRLVLPRALPEASSIYIDYIVKTDDITLNSIVDNTGATVNVNFESVDLMSSINKLDDRLKLNDQTKQQLYDEYFRDRVMRDSPSKRGW